MPQHRTFVSLLVILCVFSLVEITQANPQTQWKKTAGPEGGFIQSFLQDGPNLYAGVLSGGVYRSNNNGESWSAANAGIEGENVYALTSVGTNLYAGTDKGVYRSTNQGETWTVVSPALGNSVWIRALAVVGSDVFAGSFNGLFRFSNNGDDWTQVAKNENMGPIVALTVSGTTLFAGTLSRGVFRGTNRGESWTAVNNGLPDQPADSTLYAVGTDLYAAFGGYNSIGAIYRSTNLGDLWTALPGAGLPQSKITSFAFLEGSLFVGTFGNGVYRRDAAGAAWVESNSGLRHTGVSSLAMSNGTFFVGTQGGVFSSTDGGGNWRESIKGLNNATVCSLGTIGEDLFATTDESVQTLAIVVRNSQLRNGESLSRREPASSIDRKSANDPDRIFRSKNRGESWVPFTAGLPANEITSLVRIGATLYAGSEGAGVFRSTDNGETWIAVSNGLPEKAQIAVLLAQGPALYTGVGGYLDRGAVYRSRDQGVSWESLGTGLPESRISGLAVLGGSLFAGLLDSGVYRLNQDETTWRQINAGLPQNDTVSAMTTIGGTLFISVVSNGVYRSNNKGESWTAAKQGLSGDLVRGLTAVGGNLYAATSDGVFRSVNFGESWTAINRGLTNRDICSLTLSGSNLAAGTYGGGVFLSDAAAAAMTSVSAASFLGPDLAIDSIASAFGGGLASTTAGTRILIRDRQGLELPAPIFFASPLQANYLIPPGLSEGPASVSLTSAEGNVSLGDVNLVPVAPGLFAANGNAQGVAIGAALRVRADGSQSYEPIARYDETQKTFLPAPIDLGSESDQIYLVFYGTGFRSRNDFSSATVTIGGVNAPIAYIGAQGDFMGLDQLNVRLPSSLAGRGQVGVQLSFEGKKANVVSIGVK